VDLNAVPGAAALLIVVLTFLFKHKIFLRPEDLTNSKEFVRPVELEKAKAETLKEVDQKIKDFRETNCVDHKADSNNRFDRLQSSIDKKFDEFKAENVRNIARFEDWFGKIFQKLEERK